MANIIEDEIIKAEIQDGLSQVDANLIIEEFECVFDAETRKLRVHCTAKNKETSETVKVDNIF